MEKPSKVDGISKRGCGQPAFKPTIAQRKDVSVFKAAGLSEPAIADALMISQNTLRKYFLADLASARGAQQAINLKRIAKAADDGSVAAQVALNRIFDRAHRLNRAWTDDRR